MKPILITACIILFAARTSDSKWNLICHQWRLIGIKSFGKDFKPAKDPKDEVLTFLADATYEKLLYGQLKIKGEWQFKSDSSKLVFSVTSMNGSAVTSLPIANSLPSDSIIKLTPDTLIDARIAYFGPQKEYRHDDWYYVRIDNDK